MHSQIDRRDLAGKHKCKAVTQAGRTGALHVLLPEPGTHEQFDAQSGRCWDAVAAVKSQWVGGGREGDDRDG